MLTGLTVFRINHFSGLEIVGSRNVKPVVDEKVRRVVRLEVTDDEIRTIAEVVVYHVTFDVVTKTVLKDATYFLNLAVYSLSYCHESIHGNYLYTI